MPTSWILLIVAAAAARAEDELRDIPSVAVGQAAEAFDVEMAAVLEQHREAFAPLDERWRALDEEYELINDAARAKLLDGLLEAIKLGQRRGDARHALDGEPGLFECLQLVAGAGKDRRIS